MRLGMRIDVGILEKSRRLRTARFSLDIRYSSGPVTRGREERQTGSCCARRTVFLPAHDASRLVRETSYGIGYGRTKSEVQRRISLARKAAGGLRFRFPPQRISLLGPGFHSAKPAGDPGFA